jgi:drug/metabolite transporter (DMT)-like permease
MDERPDNITSNLRRRRVQFVLLAAAVLMLVLGLTAFSKSLRGLGLIAYYLVCMTFTLAAMLLAVRDMREIRRQTREKKIGLAEQAFDGVSAEVKEARDRRRGNGRT